MIEGSGKGEPNRAKEGGDGEVSEKSFEMRHFQVFAYPEEPELALSWAAGVARDVNNERNGCNDGGLMYNRSLPGGQNPGLRRRIG
jgi:hypothetical protein